MSPQALRTLQSAAFVSENSAQPSAATAEKSSEAMSASVLPAVLMVGVAIAVVSALFWTHAFGASNCHIRLAPYVLGITSEVSATVPAGVPCTITIRPGSTSIDALTIESPPKFGTLTPRGRTGVIYRPHNRAGGSDEFAFAIHSGASSPMQKFVIRVSTGAK